jgi:hypothetical protein
VIGRFCTVRNDCWEVYIKGRKGSFSTSPTASRRLFRLPQVSRTSRIWTPFSEQLHPFSLVQYQIRIYQGSPRRRQLRTLCCAFANELDSFLQHAEASPYSPSPPGSASSPLVSTGLPNPLQSGRLYITLLGEGSL